MHRDHGHLQQILECLFDAVCCSDGDEHKLPLVVVSAHADLWSDHGPFAEYEESKTGRAYAESLLLLVLSTMGCKAEAFAMS